MWGMQNQAEQEQFDFLDMITIYSAILQTMDYAMTVEQSSNDDIIKELRASVEERLSFIEAQNKEILEILKKDSKV